jgi:hypothetical protein
MRLVDTMVIFDPSFTEVVFFDIECYVPPEDQEKQGKSALVFNAAKSSHFILGGVFRQMFPCKGKREPEPASHIWNFRRDDEKSTLIDIYEYFNRCWEAIDKRSRRDNPDLILVGTGISRHDIPALYVRSVKHNIASKEELYETYFKAKVVDLGEAAIPLFNKNASVYPLYPKTVDELLKELGIKSTKSSGKRVWKMYEAKDFEGIKARTAAEVEDAISMAAAIIKRCPESPKSKSL